MAQVDLSIYVSIIETNIISFFLFYITFILLFIYPYFKNILLSNLFFVLLLNHIFYLFICVKELKCFNLILKLKKY